MTAGVSGPPDEDAFPNAESPGERVEITRAQTKGPLMDASLVLASQGIRHWIEYVPARSVDDGPRTDDHFILTVVPLDAPPARTALERHRRENADYKVEEPEVAAFGLFFSPVLFLAIPALFSFWSSAVPWQEWMEGRGGADAARILGGEWWRTFTAATLHADSEHFLGNMLSGYFIFNLLRRRAGPGTWMLLLTIAAAAANLTVAFLSPPGFFSLGFSSVVFAGLGLLAGIETRHFPRGLRPGLRNITPLLGAFFLAVMTGLGENSDIKVHFIGFAYGAALSPLTFWLARRGVEKAAWQTTAVLAVYAAFGAAWWLAMT